MRKRFFLMLMFVLVAIAVLGGYKAYKIKNIIALAKSGAFAPPPAAVTSVVLKRESWPQLLKAVGTVEAVNGVTVSADLPGVVEKIEFESGTQAKSGDVLLRLTTDAEQAQVQAAEAKRDIDVLSLNRQRELLKSKSASQSDYDSADALYRQSEAKVQEMKAMINRKTIRAPFDGMLGIRKVNLGQYLNSGEPIVAVQSLDPIRVNFSLPQQDFTAITVNGDVRVRTDATGGTEFKGKINAVNSLIDQNTRNFLVQATLPNPEGKLRPGMFANVEVLLPANDAVLPAPATAILYAPFGNSVFVITDVKDPIDPSKMVKGVSQHFVKLGATRGDLIAILSGVEPGSEIVTSGVFKLQNGAPVRINNSVQPGMDPAPKPEES